MIKELLSVFTKNSLMDRAYQQSFEMLDMTQEMFLKSKNILRESDTNEPDLSINDQDSAVNRFQRNVRKDVFNHLTMSGTDELASGLVLVSIVIDLERIGDHTKNIADLAATFEKRLQAGIFEERLVKIENAVKEKFERVIKCFKDSDVEDGLEILGDYKWINAECEEIVVELIKDKELGFDSGTAVALSAYLRELKRINSHLKNVATSVVNPFHRIGFKVKKKHLPE
ncbi:MAG: hypothetical protein JEY94_12700 [Melioribacteraceae bacterium]|nr:hypothetical protein [Melioribacteraceae bacterium]